MNGPLHIDHWDIVARSLRFAWKHKVLWVLGFFASVSGQNVLSWVQEGGPPLRGHVLPRLEALAGVITLLVLVWIGLLVVNIVSRAGLIAASSEADGGGEPTFERAVGSGLRAFLGMLALLALGMAALLVVTLVCAVPVVLPLAGGVPGIVIAVVIGAVLLVPYLAFLFGLTFTVTFAERALVIERAPVFGALAAGWRVTRSAFWTALVAWLVALLTGIVYGLGLTIVLLVVAVPFIILGLAHRALAIVTGVPVGLAILFVSAGAFGTYLYAFWTMLYRRLRAREPVAAAGTSGPGGPARHADDAGRTSEPQEDLLAGSI